MDYRQIFDNLPSELFLIQDEDLLKERPLFLKWLLDNGFVFVGERGRYDGCNWIYVSITHKVYVPGIPGRKVFAPIGNHAITVDEFYTIYSIYEKYSGLSELVMNREEERDPWLRNMESLTFEEYESDVKRGFFERNGYTPESEAYFLSEEAQNLIHTNYKGYIDPEFRFAGCEPAATASCLFMMFE